jgi:hypothetical protein
MGQPKTQPEERSEAVKKMQELQNKMNTNEKALRRK